MAIKVCHLTSAHDSDDVRIFQKECVSIAEDASFDVYLIAPGASREEKNVKVIGIGEKPSSRFKRMFSCTKKVLEEAVKLDADIYHFHDPELLNVGMKLKKLGKSVVFDSHEYTYEQIKIKPYLPKFLRGIVADAFLRKETKICKEIDAVIFPCKVDGFNPFEGRCKETVFINNLPKLSEFSLDSDKIIKEKPYDVCHIGSLTEARGITTLLEACKIGGYSCLLGGDFASKEYEISLREKGLLDNIDFVGYCNRQQVTDYYKKSKLGVSVIHPIGQYPIAWNLPTKVYEFMAMEIPVVISNFKYCQHVLSEYEFGVAVDPQDSKAVAEVIGNLLSDEESFVRMGKEGRRAITEEFNWEKEIEKLKELYFRIS